MKTSSVLKKMSVIYRTIDEIISLVCGSQCRAADLILQGRGNQAFTRKLRLNVVTLKFLAFSKSQLIDNIRMKNDN